MSKLLNFISGLILGGLTGAAIALLLTPRSGMELRQELQTRYIDIRDEIQTAAQTRRSELESQLESLRRPVKGSE
jgi:gas vesicle protein